MGSSEGARLDWNKLNVDERTGVVRDGISRGLSARQIAEELLNCNRNKIIGRAHKAKLQLAGKRTGGQPRGVVRARPVRAVVEYTGAVLFEHVKNGQCRWPLWGKDSALRPEEMLMCGKPAPLNKSYCEECQSRAYEPIRRRG